MQKTYQKILSGYQRFREKYPSGDTHIMQELAKHGQNPEIMIVACSDSRVDPALILQCDPGDLFVVRNVANIVPPYEPEVGHHGTSTALEFGICYLGVKHLIILGHSQCGGIHALLHPANLHQDDFISQWMSVVKHASHAAGVDDCAKQALLKSYENCLTFPWIEKHINEDQLKIHLWYFDIKLSEIFDYSFEKQIFVSLQ